MKTMIALSALLLAASPVLAHESKGPHGGRQVDAGAMHVELITKGPAIDVYVADGAGKPVDATGYKGLAILVVAGKPARIPLAPAGSDRLTGTAPADLGASVKGAVQITTSGGVTAQGKFE
jgi:hypothetical protein